MNSKNIQFHWESGAEESHRIMMLLHKNKEYTNALFYGQLYLEKLLKAHYAKNNPQEPHAPKTHNLLLLAKKCNLEFDDILADKLADISRFNLEARYDDARKDFYKRCTSEFTNQQIETIKEIGIWLTKLLIKK